MSTDSDGTEAAAAHAVLTAGARFAFVHGSRAPHPGAPRSRPESDLDIAAWWGSGAPAAWTVHVPPGVDLLVLDDAPVWLAGRVAQYGRVLAVADRAAEVERVRWQVDMRLRYLDELPGIKQRYEIRRQQLAERAGG